MLRCSVSRVGPVGLVTRAGANGEPETLVRSVGGLGFVPLEGANELAAFGCGTQLPLRVAEGDSPHVFQPGGRGAAFEPLTSSVCFADGYAILAFDAANIVRQLAGARSEPGHADGDGAAARFHAIAAIAADGGGGLFVADGSFVRHVTVRQQGNRPDERTAAAMRHESNQRPNPEEGVQAGGGGAGPGSGPGPVKPEGVAKGALGNGQGLGGAAANEGGDGSSGDHECSSCVTVSTIATGPAPWTGMSYDPRSGTLLAATCTAVYRLHPQHAQAAPLLWHGAQPSQPPAGGAAQTTAHQGRGAGVDNNGSGGSSSGGREQGGLRLMLLAGSEGQPGQANGHGPAARFSGITGLTVDRNCNAYVTDVVGGGGGSGGGGVTRIRRVAPDGGVTSAAAPLGAGSTAAAAAQEVPFPLQDPAILPNGCLAACSYSGQAVWIIALGLQPAQPVISLRGGGKGSAHALDVPRTERRPTYPSRVPVVAPGEAQSGHLRLLSGDLEHLLPPQCSPGDGGDPLDGALPAWPPDVEVRLGGTTFPSHAALLAARSAHLRRQLLGVVGPHSLLPHTHAHPAGRPPTPAAAAASTAAVRAAQPSAVASEPAGPMGADARVPPSTGRHANAVTNVNGIINTRSNAVTGSSTDPLPHITILLPHHPKSAPAPALASGGAPPADPTAAAPAAQPCPHAAAFPHLLRYMYTGRLDVPPHLLQPAAELCVLLGLGGGTGDGGNGSGDGGGGGGGSGATGDGSAAAVATGRACATADEKSVLRELQVALLAAARPATLVDQLLWAERQGLGQLLAGLKALFLDHQPQVAEQAPYSVRQLAAGSPELASELFLAAIKRQQGG